MFQGEQDVANDGASDTEIVPPGLRSPVSESVEPAGGLRGDHKDGGAGAVRAAWDRTRIVKVSGIALAITLGLIALAILPQWVVVFVPEWLFRRIAIAFLWVIAAAYSLSLIAAVVGALALGPLVVRARRRSRSVAFVARCLLL